MDSQNPWQSEESQGNPYRQESHPNYQSQPPQPPAQSQQHGWSNPNVTDQSNPWGGDSHSHTGFQQQGYQAPPNPPPRQSRPDNETAAILESQPDRGEQIEHMQNYEANKRLTQDDRNQAELQKQFPSIDSSLIAAIYNDHLDQRAGQVDMASIRETLQELQS